MGMFDSLLEASGWGAPPPKPKVPTTVPAPWKRPLVPKPLAPEDTPEGAGINLDEETETAKDIGRTYDSLMQEFKLSEARMKPIVTGPRFEPESFASGAMKHIAEPLRAIAEPIEKVWGWDPLGQVESGRQFGERMAQPGKDDSVPWAMAKGALGGVVEGVNEAFTPTKAAMWGGGPVASLLGKVGQSATALKSLPAISRAANIGSDLVNAGNTGLMASMVPGQALALKEAVAPEEGSPAAEAPWYKRAFDALQATAGLALGGHAIGRSEPMLPIRAQFQTMADNVAGRLPTPSAPKPAGWQPKAWSPELAEPMPPAAAKFTAEREAAAQKLKSAPADAAALRNSNKGPVKPVDPDQLTLLNELLDAAVTREDWPAVADITSMLEAQPAAPEAPAGVPAKPGVVFESPTKPQGAAETQLRS